MMIVQPKTKTVKDDLNRIIRRLVKILEDETINPFELHSFKLSAERMRHKDPDMAFTILGIIAGIEHDAENMHHFFKNAILHAPNSWEIRYIYANTLLFLGLYSQSVKVSEEICQRFSCYIVLINSLVQACYRAGRMREAWHWAEQWRKKKSGEAHALSQNIARLKTFFETYDISDAHAEKMQNIASQELLAQDIFPKEIRMSLVHEGAEDYLFCEMILRNISEEKVEALEQSLQQKLTHSDIPAMVQHHVVYGYALCN
ncbi:hypothetical protein ACQZV8_18795 [Magnetococcales bacterium HHB-1]